MPLYKFNKVVTIVAHIALSPMPEAKTALFRQQLLFPKFAHCLKKAFKKYV